MRNFLKLVGRFGADERGVFGVIFAVMAIVIVAFGGAVVDYVSIQQAKTRAQVALDAAALALHPKIFTQSEDDIRKTAKALVLERLAGSAIVADVDSAKYDRVKGTLELTGSVKIDTAFVRLVGVNTLQAGLLSEVTRGARNIEVAVALDTTGSMSGQKIKDLRTATTDLINIIVKDEQTPTYSKLAMAPYAANVNVGGYADAVRGTPPAPKAITNITWASAAALTITAATRSPVTITTSANHGLSTGDWVYVDSIGAGSMTQINATVYKVRKTSNTQFVLTNSSGVDIAGSNYSTFVASSGGKVTRCSRANCEVEVTSASHGFTNGQYVYVTGVGGMTQLNNKTFAVANASTNTLTLTGSTPGGTYTSGGSLYCTLVGCQYYYFTAQNGTAQTYQISTCVTERVSHAYDDTKPSITPVGPNYPSSSVPCVTPQIIPLTDSRTTLTTAAAALPASGTTAGQIGLAWAWYLVSPEFAYLFPEKSRPGAYDDPNLSKFVVLMTDGYFNTAYCNGVLSKDSTEVGSTSVRNNCVAPNGGGWTQASKLCEAIRAKATLFTVGFDIDSDLATQDLMRKCAGNSDNFYLASNGEQLKAAFREIANRISVLRVSE